MVRPAWLIAVVALAGCDKILVDEDSIYSRGARPVMCGANIDNKNSWSNDALNAGLDRASVEGTTLHLYTHRPPGSVDTSTIETVLAGAADRNLPFITYRQLVAGVVSPGLAFGFDDKALADWHPLRPLFDRYRAKVTFFVTRYHVFTDVEKQQLRDLATDGHDIQYHATDHLAADEIAAERGVAQYIADDIIPDLELMRADGYDPNVFAYPFGARSDETDAALLAYFPSLRGSDFSCPSP